MVALNALHPEPGSNRLGSIPPPITPCGVASERGVALQAGDRLREAQGLRRRVLVGGEDGGAARQRIGRVGVRGLHLDAAAFGPAEERVALASLGELYLHGADLAAPRVL